MNPRRLIPLAGLAVILGTCTVGCGAARPRTTCPEALSIVEAFYASNDAGTYDASLAFLADDVTFDSWAQGAGGNHMAARHLEGKQAIRPVLGDPGLRRTPQEPGGPVYSPVEIEAEGDEVTFRLEPDRKRTDGRPYHAYRVTLTFDGCQIAALTVIQLIYWL